MGCRAQPVRYPISRTVQQMTRETRMGQPSYTEFRILPVLDFSPAPLTIFALEEPENHLAPFYLPRLIGMLEQLIQTGASQSFITSHSTSVLSRVHPRNVRYFKNCKSSLITSVLELPLPPKGTEPDNFLHQVLLANPEIYFARLVIIGEGDSERIVIPRIAEAFDLALDPAFVAFVPIGGRHAKHLWRLLSGINLPHLTVLDFDLGRHNAGMGRIENAVTWLKEAGVQVDETIARPTNATLNPSIAEGWTKWLRPIWHLLFNIPRFGHDDDQIISSRIQAKERL